MLEIKITIEAPEIVSAINNLAASMAGSVSPPATLAQTAPASADEPTADPAPVATHASAAVPVANVPVAQPPQYTREQIMAAGAVLMDAGKPQELINLLHSFGVQAVMDLKPEQLGPFATKLRELGAKI